MLLYRDETGMISNVTLADGKVMFFFTGDPEGGAFLYWLYLPDTLFHYDSATWESFCIAVPDCREQFLGGEEAIARCHDGGLTPFSNHEVTWSSLNSEFYAMLAEQAADLQWYRKYYGNLEMDFRSCIGSAETEHLRHQLEYYYNALTDTYLVRGVGVFTGAGGYETWRKS